MKIKKECEHEFRQNLNSFGKPCGYYCIFCLKLVITKRESEIIKTLRIKNK